MSFDRKDLGDVVAAPPQMRWTKFADQMPPGGNAIIRFRDGGLMYCTADAEAIAAGRMICWFQPTCTVEFGGKVCGAIATGELLGSRRHIKVESTHYCCDQHGRGKRRLPLDGFHMDSSEVAEGSCPAVPGRGDGQHCQHWWDDDEPCCNCGDDQKAD